MKQTAIKKHFSILLIAALLISLMAPVANVKADGPVPTDELCDLVKQKKATFVMNDPDTLYLADSSVTSAKSSNSSVIKIRKSKDIDPDTDKSVTEWYAEVKKTGKTTITLKKKNGKVQKCKVTVIKYKNPFKEVKAGNSKVVMEKGSGYYIEKWTKNLAKSGKKYKVSVKLKSGYKLKKIETVRYNAKGNLVYKTVKNNAKAKLSSDMQLRITYKDKKSGKTVHYRLTYLPFASSY